MIYNIIYINKNISISIGHIKVLYKYTDIDNFLDMNTQA